MGPLVAVPVTAPIAGRVVAAIYCVDHAPDGVESYLLRDPRGYECEDCTAEAQPS
jgi:hypothetical protein